MAGAPPIHWADTSLDEGRDRLRHLLMELSVRTDCEFTLASGRRSNFYVDVKKTALHPEGAFWIGRLLLDVLNNYPEAEAVGGPTLGADPLATALSLVGWLFGRRLNAFIVRKEAKGHGTTNWIEGPTLAPGAKVVLIEDVVTSGGSALVGVERLRTAGLDVQAVLSVVDREEGGRETIGNSGLPLHALFLKRDLVG